MATLASDTNGTEASALAHKAQLFIVFAWRQRNRGREYITWRFSNL